MGSAGRLLVVEDDGGVLVLLDHRRPTLLGTAILQVIKRFFPPTKVVIITGVATEAVVIQSLRGGASDSLREPSESRDLPAQVAALLASHRAGTGRARPTADSPTAVAPPDTADRGGAILRALRYMDTRLALALSLSTVARAAGMSKYHFCRRFKASTGLSFREYLARQRIARAKALLEEPGRTITEISRDVGFKDLTHFGRVFKRLVGKRPSDFRQQALGVSPGGATGAGHALHLT